MGADVSCSSSSLWKGMLTVIGETLILHIAAMFQADRCWHKPGRLMVCLFVFFSHLFFRRRASPGAESRHGPVPVVYLRVTAGRHRVVGGERGSPRVWGKTLPAHPGHILGVSFRAGGWAAPASDTLARIIMNSTMVVRTTIGRTT